MLAPLTHVQPLTLLRRQRLLPAPGRILVRKGQQVSANEAIAEVSLAPTHLVLDVARGLGVPRRKVERYLQRDAGEQVAQGDVIAGPVGLTRRVMRAPRAGRIVTIGAGQVFFEIETPPQQVRAGLPGVVAELIEERGVVIESRGALIQGVWGNGQVQAGTLRMLAAKPEDVLAPERLEAGLRGAILAGGYCEQAETLKRAAALPVAGLILSSLSSALLEVASALPFPLMLTEGFGLLPMNTPAFELLCEKDGSPAALNAQPLDRLAGTRPEIVIPQEASEALEEPQEALVFQPNQRVRVLRAPYRSQVGVLISLRPGLDVFPSGVRAPAAAIHLENGVDVVLPLANLEVLE